MRICGFLLTALLLGGLAVADTVRLRDGTVLRGDLKRQGDDYVLIDTAGKSIAVKSADVVSLEPTPRGGSTDQAMSRLLSLRRSVEHTADIGAIIERYRAFIESNRGSPAAQIAGQDVVQWRKRLDEGLVRLGKEWLTPAEKAERQSQSLQTAEQARQMIFEGRARESEPLLEQALASDPLNLAVPYLRGVNRYQLERIPEARKQFEAVVEHLPNHPPTLNNLAVILWRQNAIPAALNQFDQAMQSAPVNRRILDNVAELLHSLESSHAKDALFKKVQRRFTEQDAQLQALMRPHRLFRWGAGWVDEKKLEELKAAEKEVQTKLDAMSAEFDAGAATVRAMEQEIADKQRRASSIEADSWGVDAQGQAYRRPYPAYYYDLLRDIDVVKAQRIRLIARLEAMRAAAKEIRQRIPVPAYSGTLAIFGAEAAPQLPVLFGRDTPPATAPASPSATRASPPATAATDVTPPPAPASAGPSSQPATVPVAAASQPASTLGGPSSQPATATSRPSSQSASAPAAATSRPATASLHRP